MKFNLKLYIGLACSLLMVIYSCEQEINEPLPGDYPAPSQLSNVQVTNVHGGAQLTYTIPQDGSVQYVEAEWTSNGKKRSAKSSAFTDTLMLDGFSSTSPHEVTVYAVNGGKQRSAPTVVTVEPLTPPVLSVLQSLSAEPAIGGLKVTSSNETGKPVIINVLAADSITGQLKHLFNHSTIKSEDSFIFTADGLEHVSQEFGFFVSDLWGNVSDTLYLTLKPIILEFHDKHSWSITAFSSENNSDRHGVANLLDNSTETFWIARFSPNPTDYPNHWVTIDMNAVLEVDGFVVAQKNGDRKIKEMEVLISNDNLEWESLGLFELADVNRDNQYLDLDERRLFRYFKIVPVSGHDSQRQPGLAEVGTYVIR